jgi:hypothetical protein
MPPQRKEMEDLPLSELFDLLAKHFPGDPLYQSASAEFRRRQFIAKQELDQAQLLATNAQIEAAENARQSLKALRRTAFWTAVAAVATALASFASSLGRFYCP